MFQVGWNHPMKLDLVKFSWILLVNDVITLVVKLDGDKREEIILKKKKKDFGLHFYLLYEKKKKPGTIKLYTEAVVYSPVGAFLFSPRRRGNACSERVIKLAAPKGHLFHLHPAKSTRHSFYIQVYPQYYWHQRIYCAQRLDSLQARKTRSRFFHD